jgi:hypothetical protein
MRSMATSADETATRGAVLALLMLLTGCLAMPVGSPVPVADLAVQRCPGAPMPLEYRLPSFGDLPQPVQFTVDRARSEWSGWGGQIVDYRAVDWSRTAAVRELVRTGLEREGSESWLGSTVVPVIAALGCWENDPRVFRRLVAYWRPLQNRVAEEAVERGPRERYGGDLLDSAVAMTTGRPTSWTEAWSAAFVSYVLDSATRRYPAFGPFAYSETHAAYAAASIDAAGADSVTHRYLARSPGAFAPRPGDVVCSYRNQARREPWGAGQAEWRLGPAHCDIVIALERGEAAGRVFAIGGNILQSVTMSVHAAGADGRLVDSPFRNWAIVLADRANPDRL